MRLIIQKVLLLLLGKNRILHWICDPNEMTLLRMKKEGYLYDTGWTHSIKNRLPVDKNNNPIPWLPYPFLFFLEKKLKRNLKLLEFGAGYSTLYFTQHIDQLTTFESDAGWYNKLVKENYDLKNKLFFSASSTDVHAKLRENKNKYDIIFIDSVHSRKEFAKISMEFLSDSGVIIVDDINDLEYAPISVFLKERGFREIEFHGIGPIANFSKSCSVFYRNNNCFDI